MAVPSSEQKQSGNKHTSGSHGGARFGSLSMSNVDENETEITHTNENNTQIGFNDIKALKLLDWNAKQKIGLKFPKKKM